MICTGVAWHGDAVVIKVICAFELSASLHVDYAVLICLTQPGLTNELVMVVQEDAGDRRYHIVITAQGTATHWQARVHYYWYTKVHVCTT